MKDFFNFVAEFEKKNEPFAIATVVKIQGSSSAKPSAKAVINQVGDVIFGWVGGGCAEAEIREEALKCLGLEKTALIDVQMNAETLQEGMACGGQMQVFIEPILPKPILWILGHNRAAQALCELANILNIKVNIYDKELTTSAFINAEKIFNCKLEEILPLIKKNDFVVIATLHINDSDTLKQILTTKTTYIAVIASKKRAALLLETCEKQDLSRIYTPAGLALGSQTPEEIALSILSEIVLLQRKGHTNIPSTQTK
jgi:xanthine dehydrogenase accessory factor